MAELYADENFDFQVVAVLRQFGHDVLTVQEAGERGGSDERVLEYARQHSRVVLTFDRHDFRRLHRLNPIHAGIISCTKDNDVSALAQRIHDAVMAADSLAGLHLRVNKP